MRMLNVCATVAACSLCSMVGHAQTVYPIDRAEILVGARFDFKVEFPARVEPNNVTVTMNGENYESVFGKKATFIEREDDEEQSALILRDVSLAQPGTYRVKVAQGAETRELAWTVYETGPRKAKNVILFIGDGMSPAHRTAARLLSKGIAERIRRQHQTGTPFHAFSSSVLTDRLLRSAFESQ